MLIRSVIKVIRHIFVLLFNQSSKVVRRFILTMLLIIRCVLFRTINQLGHYSVQPNTDAYVCLMTTYLRVIRTLSKEKFKIFIFGGMILFIIRTCSPIEVLFYTETNHLCRRFSRKRKRRIDERRKMIVLIT
jgi:hypothetical protein